MTHDAAGSCESRSLRCNETRLNPAENSLHRMILPEPFQCPRSKTQMAGTSARHPAAVLVPRRPFILLTTRLHARVAVSDEVGRDTKATAALPGNPPPVLVTSSEMYRL